MNPRDDSHNGAAYSTFGQLWLAWRLIPSRFLEPGLGPSARDEVTLFSQLPPQQLQAGDLGVGFSSWTVRTEAFESGDPSFRFASGVLC